MYHEFNFVWEASPVGMGKVGRDGMFIAVNPRFCEIVGYSETELLSRTFQAITHPDDVAPDSTEAAHLADSRTATSYQMVKRYISKDGRTVWVNLYVYAIRSSDGNFSHFFVFVTELTPLSVCPNPAAAERSPVPRNDRPPTLWEYVKNNPKEAAFIGGAIFAVAQGKNIFEHLAKYLEK